MTAAIIRLRREQPRVEKRGRFTWFAMAPSLWAAGRTRELALAEWFRLAGLA